MKKLKWCVNYEFEYDLDWLVSETKMLIDMRKDISIEAAARSIVHHAIAVEDDDVYYAFGDAQYEIIVYEILQELNEQIPLF